jgi:hypothetical protein
MSDYSHLSDAQKSVLIQQKSAALLRRANRLDVEDYQRQARADAIQAEAQARADAIERRERVARRQLRNVEAQQRADDVFAELGFRAPQATIDEHPLDYRRKLLKRAQSQLPIDHELYALNIDQIRGDDVLSTFEAMFYPEVAKWANHPTSIPSGELKKVEKIDPRSGQHTTEFYGRDSFIKELSTPGRRIRISNPDTWSYPRR